VSEWFVFVDSGDHIGPVTTELLARGLHAGRVPRDARVARGAPSGWLDVMDVSEVTSALDAIAQGKSVEEAPDPTEVMDRDEFAFAAALEKAKGPAGPPKPPLPPRQSIPPMPAAAPVAPPPPPNGPPSKGPMPAAPAAPLMTTQLGTPPPPPPPNGPPAMMTTQAAPPPPMTQLMGPPLHGPPLHGPPLHGPPLHGPPPPSLAPSVPPPPAAPPVSVAPPKGDKAEEKKAPPLDPKLTYLVPLGTFGIFVVFSIFVVLYALIRK